MSTSDDRFDDSLAKIKAGVELRDRVYKMKDKGYSNAAIADALGVNENRVRDLLKKLELEEHQIIWFPETYHGRTDAEYTQIATHLNFEDLVILVQKRAMEDGEWAIENGFVGDNEDKMRRMMAFVSSETNIRQCVEHIHKENLDHERTVDWVCRDLANASKAMVR